MRAVLVAIQVHALQLVQYDTALVVRIELERLVFGRNGSINICQLKYLIDSTIVHGGSVYQPFFEAQDIGRIIFEVVLRDPWVSNYCIFADEHAFINHDLAVPYSCSKKGSRIIACHSIY